MLSGAESKFVFFRTWSVYLRRRLGGNSKRVFILPTWFSFVFNLCLLMLLIASFPLKSFALLGLVVFLIFVQLLSMVESHVNLRGLTMTTEVDLVVEASSQVVFSPEVSSREESLGISFKVVESRDSPTRSGLINNRNVRKIILKELFFSWISSLRSDEIDKEKYMTVGRDPKTIETSFEAPTRGVYQLPPIMVVSLFPFGLFRAVKIMPFSGVSYFVYPTPKRSDFTSQGVNDDVIRDVKAAAESQATIGSEDYSHHRPFRNGDTVQRVDWRASSRRGIKIVKVFSSGKSPEVRVLSWNKTTSFDVEGKLSELAFGVIQASKGGQNFALELPGMKTKAGHGERHKKDCLRLLAVFELSKEELAA
jgi:hypothetical protein